MSCFFVQRSQLISPPQFRECHEGENNGSVLWLCWFNFHVCLETFCALVPVLGRNPLPSPTVATNLVLNPIACSCDLPQVDHPPSRHCWNSSWSRESAFWTQVKHSQRGQKRNLFTVGGWHFTVYKSLPAQGTEERECPWSPLRLTHGPNFWIFFPLQRWGCMCSTDVNGKQISVPWLYVIELWVDYLHQSSEPQFPHL